VDLGAGGAPAALFDGRADGSRWLLVDLDAAALAGAARLRGAMRLCCDVRDVPQALAAGIASLVIANPPFNPLGSSRRPSGARRDLERTRRPLDMLMFARAAAHLLRRGGEFRMVGRPADLAGILVCCEAFDLRPFEILPFGEPGRPAATLRVRASAGAGRPLELLPQVPFP
jgi:tRNA1(Val) A37 N6-methylase TrmN6